MDCGVFWCYVVLHGLMGWHVVFYGGFGVTYRHVVFCGAMWSLGVLLILHMVLYMLSFGVIHVVMW